MKKRRARSKKPLVLHMALGLGVALIATTWYWSGVRDFYSQTAQAAAAFLGLFGS